MKTLKQLLFLLLPISLFAQEQKIILGAGYFWGVERYFENLHGIQEVTVGYAGGDYPNPTYQTLLNHRFDTNMINHAEVVQIIYDDANISTQELLQSFWELHDPTQGNHQGNDRGNNYRSAIYTTTLEQQKIAHETKEVYQMLLNKAGYGKITTEIKPLRHFYLAEAYHQDYLKKHPHGYCPNHATGVKFTRPSKSPTTPLTPLKEKEIIVISAPFCPFCKMFQKEVLANYHGSIPLRVAQKNQLQGFKNLPTIVGTPTLLYIQDGKVIQSHTGYIDAKNFYKTLGAFKLGEESEGYKVAFEQKTDGRFCKQYKAFQNTGDDIFIDKISGEPLFDTHDRFNSGSGWLSFTKAIDGATLQKEDNSFGMHRTEVIAKKSGAHLGHVFDDGPNGLPRFCINATILEFVPREEIKNLPPKSQ